MMMIRVCRLCSLGNIDSFTG